MQFWDIKPNSDAVITTFLTLNKATDEYYCTNVLRWMTNLKEHEGFVVGFKPLTFKYTFRSVILSIHAE